VRVQSGMGKNSTHAWSLVKKEPKPLLHRNRTEYPDHKRAEQTYSQWLCGYAESEIADFFGIDVEDVLRDVQHVHQVLPVRTVIAQLNDRNRLLIQRAEAAKYRKLLADSLETPVKAFLEAGVSPVGPLREYREAVGQIAKAEPLVAIQQNFNASSSGVGGGIRSAEDLIRAVLRGMEQEDTEIIEATAREPAEETRNDEDTIQDNEEPSSPFEPPDEDE